MLGFDCRPMLHVWDGQPQAGEQFELPKRADQKTGPSRSDMALSLRVDERHWPLPAWPFDCYQLVIRTFKLRLCRTFETRLAVGAARSSVTRNSGKRT